jgi:hypothetical protein
MCRNQVEQQAPYFHMQGPKLMVGGRQKRPAGCEKVAYAQQES